MEAKGSAGVFQALRSRDFAILWFGNLLSNIGAWIQQVAEPWLVLRLSSSPFLLGVDSFMGDAPVWLLVLVGGLLADRGDRRRTALLFQGLQAACPILVVALLVTGRLQVWMLLVLSLAVGITDALSGPSINSLAPSLVPEDDVPSAVALNSAQFNLSRVLGPLFAGLLMAAFGAVVCFAVNAASYAPYLLAIYLLRIPARASSLPLIAGAAASGAQPSIREAVATVTKDGQLLRALSIVMLNSVFCMPTVTFMPVLVRDAFHLGSTEFGAALSAFGLGGLVGAAGVLALRTNRQRRLLSSLASLGLGALIAATARGQIFAEELALLFVIGGALVASNTASNSILQSSIDGRLRGRISSLYTLALRGGAPLGNLVTGVVVSHWGVRTALLVNGILAALCQTALLQKLATLAVTS